jgi:hypothetical protein
MVSWQNENIFKTNSLKTFISQNFFLTGGFTFEASIPLAVAHNDKENYKLYKIERNDLRNARRVLS